jgi:hypothetical protein
MAYKSYIDFDGDFDGDTMSPYIDDEIIEVFYSRDIDIKPIRPILRPLRSDNTRIIKQYIPYFDILCDNIPEYVKNVITCPKCNKLMVDPKLLICDHTICNTCYDDVIGYTDILKLSVKCPICKKQYIVDKNDENTTVKSIVSDLNIICPDKCEWIGTIGNLKYHLEKCENFDLTCNYCFLPMNNKEFDKHKQECEDFIVKCASCDLYHVKKLKESHDAECSFKTITCHKCSVDFIAYHELQHIGHECLKRSINCSFCKESITFDQKDIHEYKCGNKKIKCGFCNANLINKAYNVHLVLCSLKQEERTEKNKQRVYKKHLKKYGKS